MSPTRRSVLAGLGGATLAYALQVGCAPGEEPPQEMVAPAPRAPDNPRGRPNDPNIEAREWLIIAADGSVTAYTSRTEIGQGLTTIMFDLITQALELPRERVNVVLGDTDVCPHHGPTTGSATTRYVAWTFWKACHQIKEDLVLLAAEEMGQPADQLRYRAGEVVDTRDESRRMGIGELADGRVRHMRVDNVDAAPQLWPYRDYETPNVNTEAIVTGTLMFTGDYHPDGCIYGVFATPAYHHTETRFRVANILGARAVDGVIRVNHGPKGVAVLGETYSRVQAGLEVLNAKWTEPERPVEFDKEAEIRAGAELEWNVEDKGDVDGMLERSDVVVTETYITQYMSQVPLETPTALASMEDGRITLRLGNQNPFWVRHKAAQQQGIPAADVHVMTPPAGGAFGSKADHTVGEESAQLLQLSDKPVKYVYSREDDIRRRSRYKEAVVFDVSSGIDGSGRIVARKIDIFQDEGHGTTSTYRIPHARTRLFKTKLPMRHGTMRGTSYVQSIFGMESHTDVLAHAIGADPLEFRRRNIEHGEFRPLIDACAEMFDYGAYQAPEGNGVGFALCNHGGRQLAVVGAEVSVDRESGLVRVVRLAGALDIGVVINRNLATNGIKSGMIWGLGAALREEVEVDGHKCHTTGFTNYHIARMSDTPPIEIAYLDNTDSSGPRGCGEVSVPPTLAAIANAVYDAIGVRFYELPITPERVKAALAQA